MTYQRRKLKWPWKDFLTEEESAALARAAVAKATWQRLNRERSAITNRALQRAKYHTLIARSASKEKKI